MPNTAQKRYYSVKEAAKLIGVSTNTIYTYLKTGQLKSRRIGMGRIKISSESVIPYIQNIPASDIKDNPVLEVTENVTFPMNQGLASEDSKLDTIGGQTKAVQTVELTSDNIENTSPIVSENSDIIPNKNDIFFFRIFKGISFLGLGIIYFLTAKNVFNFSLLFSPETNEVLTLILPYVLLCAGIFNIFEVLYPNSFTKTHPMVDVTTILILSYYLVMAINSGDLARVIYICPFIVVALSHIVQFPHMENKHTFFDGYIKFTLAFSVVSGVIIYFRPSVLPLQLFNEVIESHLNIVGIIWFSFLVFPLLYYISGLNTSPKNAAGYFVFRALLAFVIGTQFLVVFHWDLAYLTFLIAIFDLFLAWWQIYGTSINRDRSYIMVLIFGWIGATILIGNISIRYFQNSLIEQEKSQLLVKLQAITNDINTQISQNSSLLTFYSGQGSLRSITKDKNTEMAISVAKEIYDKSRFPRRVVLMDREGVAIGVYPRDSLTQGANLSSRVYFQKTKEMYASYFSPIYKDLSGEAAVMQTEPIFEENNFIGMIGHSPDLEAMSASYRALLGDEIHFSATDKVHALTLSNNITQIGSSMSKDIISASSEQGIVSSSSYIPLVGWNLSATTKIGSVFGGASNSNIYLTTILIINSFVSLAIGMSLVSKKNTNKSTDITNSDKQILPQF